MLLQGEQQLRIDIANEFLMRYGTYNNWQFRMLYIDDAYLYLYGNVNANIYVQCADTESSRYDTSTYIWHQSCCVVRHYIQFCFRPVLL